VIKVFHSADSRKLCPQPPRSSPERAEVTFLQAGRVVPRKGGDLLLAALARLRDAGLTQWKLLLLGPDVEGWGTSQIEKYGLQAYVQITGHLEGDKLWQVFGQADVFVLATRQDTYAAVVHEAACLGLPLIVSKHAGAAEALVEDGINGFIIDPEDTVAFADRLKMLFDPSLRSEMSAAALLTGEQFSAHVRGRAVWDWIQNHFIRIS
jgi:glycosyltransferase involved in cell wall biosynthesis